MASIIENVKGFAHDCGDAPALTAGNDLSMSYSELVQAMESLASQIADAANQVDMLVLMTHRNALQVVGMLAGLQLKCPVAVVDLRQGSERLLDILQQGHRLLCLVDAQGDKVVAPLLKEGRLPLIHYYFLFAANNDGSIAIRQHVCEKTHSRDKQLAVLPNDTALILYTSGSTGTPKGVCIAADDLTSRLHAEQAWFELVKNDTILGVLPLNFDVGVTQLLGTLFTGAHHVLANSWLPADIFNHISARSINGLAMSPMVWRQLLKTKDESVLWQHLNQLRYVTLSGGTLDVDTLEHIARHLTATLIKTYGQTEMFRIASLKIKSDSAVASLIGSVGKAYSDVELSIVNESGEHQLPGIRGEVVAKGMGQMAGYVPSIKQYAEPNDCIHTGDIGYLDDEGHLFIDGRKNEMVKIFDQRIFPDDVANSLQKILDIRPVAVVATTAAEPKLVAFIEEASTLETDQSLKAQLRGKLAGHLIPVRFERLSQLPSTANGKIDKIQLRKQL